METALWRIATPGAGAIHPISFRAGEEMVARQGAQAILLGGTDLNVAFENHSPPFDIIDCAGIHIDAIAAKL